MPKHKQNTDARKAQNRNASRAYRERRKQRLALLGEILNKEQGRHASETPTAAPDDHITQPPPVNQVHQTVPLACEDLSFDSPWPIPLNSSLSSLVLPYATAVPDPLSRVPKPPLQESATTSIQAASSSTALGNWLQLLEQRTDAEHHAKTQCFTDQTAHRDEGLSAFLGALMSIQTPSVQRAIYIQQDSLWAAVMDNTLAIGCLQGMQLMFSEDGLSPFSKNWPVVIASRDSGSVSSPGGQQQLLSQIRAQFAATPIDLQPVDEQITIEHHIYLDVIPFPSFRQRALTALAQDPPLFDEDELCADITTNSGLVIWGSRGNDQGMEASRSWDMRSWEPKPWFLRKYWFLVGGWDDEMWKASRWWHGMRNEKIETTGPPPVVVGDCGTLIR